MEYQLSLEAFKHRLNNPVWGRLGRDGPALTRGWTRQPPELPFCVAWIMMYTWFMEPSCLG